MAIRRIDSSLLVVLAGVSAALHVGKLPPAIPVLQMALQISLLQAGFLLSLVQLAGMTLGLAAGLAADSLGLKRIMVAGLAILSVAGFAGAGVHEASQLLVLRGVEGFGFLLASMPAPGLIRRLVTPQRLRASMGLWGAYMPLGTALALLAGPSVIAAAGWPFWWCAVAGISAFMAVWVALVIPADPVSKRGETTGESWKLRLRQTLSARGPWLIALSFAMYSGQWLAVVGFLPSIYSQAGISGHAAAIATALAAAVNIVGNVSSGRLLQRGVPPQRLLRIGFGVMGAAGVAAFAPLWSWAGPVAALVLPYTAVLLFSMVGGMIPGTLFFLSVQLAPNDKTVSTTVGWMQQWSSVGQFVGPPLVAWVAMRFGGWQWSWLVTGACAAGGLLLAGAIASRIDAHPTIQGQP